jgi:hypothetical protein
MRMPGFTAESSIYRTTARYAMAPRSRSAGTSIVPAEALCGDCTCDTCCVEVAHGSGSFYCRCCDPPAHPDPVWPRHHYLSR